MLRVAEHFAKTDTGRQRRANEDALFARAPVFAVADGMGGARAGEVASRIVVETFEKGLVDDGSAEERLADRVREANQRIYELASTDSRRAGMGTTLTAAYVGEDAVSVAHVGDSRAYRLRDGELERLTVDHSLVGELVRRGKLTEEEAEDHPQKSVITRALGPEPDVDVDTRTYSARAGDVFLLCSDGLTAMVPEAEIAGLLSEPSLERAGKRLVDEANRRGGRDNITVVLFRLEQVGDRAEPEPEPEQPTRVGDEAPASEEVAAAVAAAGGAGAPTEERPRRTIPLPRRWAPTPGESRRRRLPRSLLPGLATLGVVVLVLAAGWVATRAIYFVGTDGQGFVTVYRGLPYDLPAGVHLYQRDYVSGVAAAQLPTKRRDSLLDHKLRSKSDASDLVRKLELGQVR